MEISAPSCDGHPDGPGRWIPKGLMERSTWGTTSTHHHGQCWTCVTTDIQYMWAVWSTSLVHIWSTSLGTWMTWNPSRNCFSTAACIRGWFG